MSTSPILDELEMWIKRAKACPEPCERLLTEKEAATYLARYGPHELILGPFVIRRERAMEEPLWPGGGR